MMQVMNIQTHKKEEMTLDRFAEIVMAEFIDLRQDMTNGFSELENKIDSVDLRLSNRIDGVESKLTSRIDNIDYKIDKLEQKMEYRFDELSCKIDTLAVDKVSLDEHNELVKKLTLKNVL